MTGRLPKGQFREIVDRTRVDFGRDPHLGPVDDATALGHLRDDILELIGHTGAIDADLAREQRAHQQTRELLEQVRHELSAAYAKLVQLGWRP